MVEMLLDSEMAGTELIEPVLVAIGEPLGPTVMVTVTVAGPVD